MNKGEEETNAGGGAGFWVVLRPLPMKTAPLLWGIRALTLDNNARFVDA